MDLVRLVTRDFMFTPSEEILTIVAILSGESILVTSAAKREEALGARKKFASSEGDHITYLKLFRAFKKSSDKVRLK